MKNSVGSFVQSQNLKTVQVGRIVGHHNLVGAGIGKVHGAYSHHGRQAAQAPE